MDRSSLTDSEEQARNAPVIPHQAPLEGPGRIEAARSCEPSGLRRLLALLGPGFITGASDDDPSGIGTYTSVGARFGYPVLWMAPLSLPLMFAVQYICAKIGMVTGEGLAAVLRKRYSARVVVPAILALVVANTINAGVDIGAIAAGIHLIAPVPVAELIVPVTLIILLIQILGSYRTIANVFKWLTLSLFAYIAAAFFAKPDVSAVMRGTLIPSFRLNRAFLMALVAVFGTTISPYLFFWQASEEVEEEISAGRKSIEERKGATDRELEFAGFDVGVGMVLSNVVMYFIILTTAATLHQQGMTNVSTAAEAASALEPLAGRGATYLFAIGLIGSGFLAVPVLTGASAYAAGEAMGWRYGFDQRPRQAKAFYGLIVGATLVGMLINFAGVNAIEALYWSAVINGLLAPPLLFLVMRVSGSQSELGSRANHSLISTLGWITASVMALAALGLVGSWVAGR